MPLCKRTDYLPLFFTLFFSSVWRVGAGSRPHQPGEGGGEGGGERLHDECNGFGDFVTTFQHMNQLLLSYVAAALLTAAAVAIEHMAFRTPSWQGRELARRAIGDTTVLAIFFALPVLFGGADAWTWAGVVGLFVLAAAIKWLLAYRDGLRRAELMRGLSGDETAD